MRPTAALLEAARATAARIEGERIAAEAREWIGTPVRWEASLKPSATRKGGADCRGLLAGVARECGRPEANELEARVVGYSLGIDERALLAGLDRLFEQLPETSAPEPGDVLAFRVRGKVQHLAIAVGGGRMVHAYLADPAQVLEMPIGTYWGNRLAGVWRWRALESGNGAAQGIGTDGDDGD